MVKKIWYRLVLRPWRVRRIKREVRRVLDPLQCTLIAIGPDAVAVKGDAREVGPSVIISCPLMPHDEVALLSTKITNEVRFVCRVLIDIPAVGDSNEA